MKPEEPVSAPDQHRPMVRRRTAKIGGIVAILLLLAMTWGNHPGNTENYFLIGIAAVIALSLLVDTVLRRAGLRRYD